MDDPDAFVARRLADLIADMAADDDARWDSAADLRDMGPLAVAAVPALVRAIHDRRATEFDPYARGMIADALGSIGPGAHEAIHALADCAMHESSHAEESRWLRLRAAVATFKISGDGQLARIVAAELLNDPQEWLRAKAAQCLSLIEGRTEN